MSGMTTTPVASSHAPLRERVAEEVRVALTRRRMSAARLARELGVSQTYVWRRLGGETAFDLDDLERIAGILGVTVRDLIPPSGMQTTTPKVTATDRLTSPKPPARSAKASIRGPIGRPRTGEITRCHQPIAPGQRRPERLNNPLAVTRCVMAA